MLKWIYKKKISVESPSIGLWVLETTCEPVCGTEPDKHESKNYSIL